MLSKELSQAAFDKTAMAFFDIQGKQTDGGDVKWPFTSTFALHCQRANEATNGRTLDANASVLLQADA